LNWREKLKRLVNLYKTYPDVPEPGYLYTVEQPELSDWPIGLPSSSDLREYFAIFGGGTFGLQIRFNPLQKVMDETKRWFDLLHDDEIFLKGANRNECVILANDADGTPWVYNVKTGRVSSYYWKAGSWDVLCFDSLGEFIDYVFKPEPSDEDWPIMLAHAGIIT
jgi:hypothetical protein